VLSLAPRVAAHIWKKVIMLDINVDMRTYNNCLIQSDYQSFHRQMGMSKDGDLNGQRRRITAGINKRKYFCST